MITKFGGTKKYFCNKVIPLELLAKNLPQYGVLRNVSLNKQRKLDVWRTKGEVTGLRIVSESRVLWKTEKNSQKTDTGPERCIFTGL